MDSTYVIAASIVLQLVAAAVALGQVRGTELKRAWIAVAAALLLMTIPRSITLLKMMTGEITQPPSMETELITLEVSFLMGLGIAYSARLFRSLKRANAELIKSQRSLIEGETRTKIFFENSPDAILMIGPDGTLVNMNRAAEELVDCPREKIAARHWTDIPLLSELGLSEDLTRAGDPSADAPVRTAALDFTRESGQTLHVEVRKFSVHIQGKPYVLAVARDVTERVRLEAEKAELEAQLRHAERLQTVGTLAGGIAHDFNNILTPIVGYTELAIQEDSPSSPTRDHLEHVIRAALRAKDLVHQILAFSRQAEQKPEPIRLQPLIKEALTLLRASLPTTIEIETNIDPECGVVMADAAQIHQVLMNLCTNAFHAMRESGGTLTVSLCQTELDSDTPLRVHGLSPGPYAHLSVRDTGHGMDRATMKRVFEPFFTTKPEGQGTGLGLSVVHGIVTAHGGAITVESDPGTGTEFDIYLPLDTRPTAKRAIDEQISVRGSERILLVDDEPEITAMLSLALTRLGYRVTHCSNGPGALETFSTRPDDFDVVVTDQTMPVLTGIELAGMIKKIRPRVPVVIMSGYSEKISPENYRVRGVDGFISKPVLAAALSQLIRHVVQTAQSAVPV